MAKSEALYEVRDDHQRNDKEEHMVRIMRTGLHGRTVATVSGEEKELVLILARAGAATLNRASGT